MATDRTWIFNRLCFHARICGRRSRTHFGGTPDDDSASVSGNEAPRTDKVVGASYLTSSSRLRILRRIRPSPMPSSWILALQYPAGKAHRRSRGTLLLAPDAFGAPEAPTTTGTRSRAGFVALDGRCAAEHRTSVRCPPSTTGTRGPSAPARRWRRRRRIWPAVPRCRSRSQ